MKLSKLGLSLGLIYFLMIVVCVIWGNTFMDPKSKFVILQLPLTLQMAGLHEIGILKYFSTNTSWLMVYIVIGIPTLLLFYLIGYFIEKTFLRVMVLTKK